MKNLQEKRCGRRTVLSQSLTFELSVLESGRLTTAVKEGVGVDLGSGGIGMTTGHPLQRGEVVKLFYPVTEDGTLLPVFTEVMWAVPEGDQFRAGMRFLN